MSNPFQRGAQPQVRKDEGKQQTKKRARSSSRKAQGRGRRSGRTVKLRKGPVSRTTNYYDSSRESTRKWERRLLKAILRGNVRAVATALANGASPSAQGAKVSAYLPPLHFACLLSEEPHVDIVHVLLSAGADPNHKVEMPANEMDLVDQEFERLWARLVAPALFYAIGLGRPWGMGQGQVGVLQALLKGGADPNQESNVPAETEFVDLADMPLCLAMSINNVDAISLLLENGADPNSPCLSRLEGVDRPIDAVVTPLHIVALAAGRRDEDVVASLLLQQDTVYPLLNNTLTEAIPFVVAAMRGDDWLCDKLLGFGYGLYAVEQLTAVDLSGMTALDHAESAPRYQRVIDVIFRHAEKHDVDEALLRGSPASRPSAVGPDVPRLEVLQRHSDNGGWEWREEDELTHPQLPPSIDLDRTRCDFDRIPFQELSVEDFVRHYKMQSRPVVLTGNLTSEWKAWASFRKDAFLKRFGRITMQGGVIPYGEVYGRAHGEFELREFVSEMDLNATSEPWIVFQNKIGTKSPEFMEVIGDAPAFFDPPGQTTEMDQTQLSLGSHGSGAPFHAHAAAFNALFWGRKHWWFSPPALHKHLGVTTHPDAQDRSAEQSGLHNSGEHTMVWLKKKYHEAKEKHAVFECVQRAGDVMFVPQLWSHSTLNVGETLCLATEFGSDDIGSHDINNLFFHPFLQEDDEDRFFGVWQALMEQAEAADS